MRSKIVIALIAMLLLVSSPVSASDLIEMGQSSLSLSEREISNAVVISDINERPVVLRPGEDVLYYLEGDDVYVKAYSRSYGMPQIKSIFSLRPEVWIYTQECGYLIYWRGIGRPRAKLVNRVNVAYDQWFTGAPAMFRWADMRGTNTSYFLWSWSSLDQRLSPGLGQHFNSIGSSTATGNFLMSFEIAAMKKTQTFVSTLLVTRGGTSCR